MDIKSIKKRLNTLQKLKDSLQQDMEIQKQVIEAEQQELRALKKGASIEKVQGKLSVKLAPISKPVQQKVAPQSTMTDEEKKAYIQYRDKNCDKTFFQEVKGMLEQIPESNGSKFYSQLNVNIGIIADEFLFNSFKGMANFTYITRENYKKYANDLDVFFVATTWKGLNLEWKGLGNPKIRKHRQDLFKIIDFYKSKGIKVVFYSKEDPVNYEYFIEVAKKCDYIFTTAEEVVADYKRDCKNDRVDVLSFGINPLYHNPVGIKKFEKRKEVLFAGSWYEKYPHRQIDTKMLFDGAIEAGEGLKIIDRNFELNLVRHFFPKEYIKYVSPSLDHGSLQKLHKLYDWSMNLNSVKYSPTMFANRVYELQALGNILLSNYSTAINNKFPNVFLVHEQNEVKDILHGFTEEERYRHQVYGIRTVMSNETTIHRLEQLFETIGFPYEKTKKNVAVVVKNSTNCIRKMFEQQTYPYKELILEKNFTDKVKQKYDMIAFFDENKEYGEFYLEDMINGFKYTNSDYITKDAYYEGKKLITGIEHDYVTTMNDKYRTIFWSELFTAEKLLKMNGKVELPNGYSIDHFELNSEKQKVNKQKNNKKYKLSVIVPSYNNGAHLLNKCFNSLKRSSMFKDMEIIIVDDGSTDDYTPTIGRYLEKQYDNVKTFFFTDGGSGSASRPRNKGFELSTTPYITYLDPDNEAINDGYAKLYEEIKTGQYDFVVGNMPRIANDVLNFDYYKTVMHFNKSDVIQGDMKQYLINTQFKAMSIQALVMKRELIADNSLKMVEGATGQDTLFFQELLLNAKKVKAINLGIHVYYAAVSGSAVNSISKKFFEKYLILEKERIKTFKEHGLFDAYLEKRFEYFFKNWYLEKLKKVSEEEALDSVKILTEIFDLYKDEVHLVEPVLIRFAELCKKKDYDMIVKEFVA
ncbi:glycosyltransferase [Bacillus cereus]|uniref:Glycosyl transferase family 2 n=1 Tax=Bacillus cereus TaxID=1396 RepID=A0AA44TDT9_BACCE|nr:glycosyltransferase [Bacillus cereus]PFN07107.1 glycosyl transferase family 2 [Bacillus cereus]PFR89953.1 glycosyl transferase family 2 [Bacillus cereus]